MRTAGFETCPVCDELSWGSNRSTASTYRKHFDSLHRWAQPDYNWLVPGEAVKLHDRGVAHPVAISGQFATVVSARPLKVATDSGHIVKVQPSECEPASHDWRTRRLLVTGSRNWSDPDLLQRGLDEAVTFLGTSAPVTLVSGACPTGADRLAELYWQERGWPVERYPADFATLGKRAAFLRNALMARLGAGVCAAFPEGRSVGTRMTMTLAAEAGIPVMQVFSSDRA